jgi:hypothetical protein
MTRPFALLVVAALAGITTAQPPPAPEKVLLYEDFQTRKPVRIDIGTTLSGRLALPDRENKRDGKPEVVTVTGTARLDYDEVLLPRDAEGNLVALRQYRDVEFRRRLGDTDQQAGVRAGVRRMVVLRNAAGKKVPFSPDGPLTLAEIDVVRTDLFSPVLVTGLLPKPPAGVGNTWPASDAAVVELTDFNEVEKNELVIELAAFLMIDGRKHAKLTIAGTVRGTGEDGVSIQTFAGTGYFDTERKIFVSLSLSAKNQLLGPDGKTVNGEVAGTFVVRRAYVTDSPLTAEVVKGFEPTPTDAKTRLLFNDPEFGATFTYPRRWRLGTVGQGRLTVNEATGAAGIQLTRYAPDGTTVDKQFAEAKELAARQKWTVTGATPPKDGRFTLSVTTDKGDNLKLDTRVLSTADGVTVLSARYPVARAAELLPQIDSILDGVTLAK